MICRSDDVSNERVPGVTYYLFSANDSYVKKIATIRSHLNTFNPDILHSHFLSYGGMIGTLTGFHPHVISLWGCDVINVPNESYLKKAASKIALRGADGWLSVSRHIQEESHSLAGEKDNSEVAIWGIDTESFKPQIDRDLIKQKLGISPNAKFILSPRILQSHYNQHILLESFKNLVKEDPNIMLIIIQYNFNIAYKAKLISYIEQHNLSKNVLWQKHSTTEELANLYSAADVVVSIPRTDGTPMTVLEAMSCGAIVAASNLPSLQDWITHTKTGWLVETQNAHALYKSLKEILTLSPIQKSVISTSSRQVILEKATVEHCVSIIEKSYLTAAVMNPKMNHFTTIKNIIY